MRRFVATMLMWAGAGLGPWAQPVERAGDSAEKAFTSGGRVQLKLAAGGYRVQAGRNDRILVRWSTKNEDQLRKVRVGIDVRGKDAVIETDGPKSDFEVVIELPARVDLHARLSAGELEIRDIEGNKDVSLRAGELSVDIGATSLYNDVDASVTVGELDARPFKVNKGGLWRSFDWSGSGAYTLRAHVTAGELRLR
jgi:hypothetical protein